MGREITINWPSEGVQSNNINSCSNRTIAFSGINFLRVIQLDLWRGEIHQGNPEVLGVGN